MARKTNYELCLEIEKLPASEQQTKCSLLASEIRRSVSWLTQVAGDELSAEQDAVNQLNERVAQLSAAGKFARA